MGSPRRPEFYAVLIYLEGLLCRAILLLAAATLAAVTAGAQSESSVFGTLVDSAGHPVARATLQFRNDNSTYTTTSAGNGTFVLAHLPPEGYRLEVRAAGVLTAPSVLVEIPPGDAVELRVELRSSAQPVVTLPGEGSDTPGALPDQTGDAPLSFHGLYPTQSPVPSADGASSTQAYNATVAGQGSDPDPDPEGDSDSAERSTGPANGLARGRHAGIAYLFSQASIREVRVTGQTYSAALGRSGEVATLLTRSGGGEMHGSAFFVLRSQAFAAANSLSLASSYKDGVVNSSVVKPHDLRENLGAAIGGPLPRRLAYFYSFDAQRRGFPAISSPGNPSFYALTPMQTALLGTRGVSASARNAALEYVSSLTGSVPRRADQTLHFGRLDWRFRPRFTPSIEYNRARWSSPAGLVDAPVVARGRASIGNASGSLDLLLLRVASTFGPHRSNQVRASLLRDLQFETPQAPLPQEPAISPGGLAPEVNIGPDGLLFGTPSTLSQLAFPDERRVQFSDTVSLLRGAHLFEMGGELSLIHDQVATLGNAAGTFRYDSGATGGFAGGLVDFVSDFVFNVNASQTGACPSIAAAVHLPCFRSFSQSFGQTSVAFSTQDYAAFLQDTFRPARRVLLRLGMRYDYTLLPIPQTPNPALDAVFSARGASSVFPEDRNNFGPRAALSAEPFGANRGLVRVGYGIYFGRLPGATIQAALTDTALPSTTTRIRIKPSASTACPQVPAKGFAYACSFLAQPSGVVALSTSAIVFDRRFRLPMIQQGSVSFERSLRTTTLAATYLFNLDRQLPGSSDLNIAPATSTALYQLQGGTGAPGVRDGETFRLPLYTSRVSPSFGPVSDVLSGVNATYHALTVAAQTRPSPTFALRASFTWSKAIDFGPNQSAMPRTDTRLDPFSGGLDKGLSTLNYPFDLRADAVWTPLLRTSARWLEHTANHWQLTPIVVARSGRPYSFDLSGGTFLPGGHESLNGSGGALYLPTVGRNTLRLPATLNTDLRLSREFPLTKRVHSLFSAEAFNLFNHRSVTSVEQRAFLVGVPAGGITPLVFQSAAAIASEGLNTQPFATPTSSSTSLARERQIQLSLHVIF